MPRMKMTGIASNNSSNITDFFSTCTSFCDNLTETYMDHTIDLNLNKSWDNLNDVSNLTNWPFYKSKCNDSEEMPILTNELINRVIVLSILSVLSIIGNLATIYSIMKNYRKRRVYTGIYTLILHLSVADVLVAIFCMGGNAIWYYNVSWPWGNAACKILKFMQMFSLYLSTYVLVLIGIDRFMAVRYPMRGLNTPKKCPQSIMFAWILSAIFAAPQSVIFHLVPAKYGEVVFIQCATHGFYTERWQDLLYNILITVVMFFVPLIILISTYVSTVILISRSRKMFNSNLPKDSTYDTNSNINRTRLINRAKVKSLRISIIIIAAFLMWWTPYYTMLIIVLSTECPDKNLSRGVFIFGMSNSLVNPLIYGAFHLWPQKRKKGSNKRSDSTIQRSKKSRNTETLLLHQDSNIVTA